MTQTFDAPLVTDDQGMDRLLRTGLPVLLVFYAGDPSPELRKELERIARERAGKLLVARAEVRAAAAAARRFAVASTPAAVGIRDGTADVKTDDAAAGDLEALARFMLGEGPRPVARTAERTAAPGAAGGTDGPAGPVYVTDATFEQVVLRAAKPVLVDFWAPWCGPCRITNPMLERLARDQAGRLVVAKVNVDESPLSAERFGIQAIPTVLVFKEGNVIDQWSGAMPEHTLRSRVAALAS